jgi:hypothetical protein
MVLMAVVKTLRQAAGKIGAEKVMQIFSATNSLPAGLSVQYGCEQAMRTSWSLMTGRRPLRLQSRVLLGDR